MTTAFVMSLALQAACGILLLASGVGVWMAWKGCRVLRQLAFEAARDDAPILLKSPAVPAVSAIMVARDASAKSFAFAHRLLELLAARHELVVVLAGVDADGVDAWRREFYLQPSERACAGDLKAPVPTGVYESTSSASVVALEVEAAKEGACWNAGVNASVSPVLALFDPETEVTPESLLRLIPPMLEDPDMVFAVIGAGPAPPAAGLAGGVAYLEAVRVWLGRCAAFAGWKHTLAPVPGAAILVRRDAVVLAGGFAAGPLELFLNLQGRVRNSGMAYRTAFVPEPPFRLPSPRTWGELRRRIMRDQRAIARSLRHNGSIMDGLFAIGWGRPAVIFDRFFRPLLETATYITAIIGLAKGLVSPELGLLVLLTTVGFGIPVSMSMVVFRELSDLRGSDSARLMRLFWAAVAENLGYRQMRNLWLMGGFVAGLFRKG